MMLRYKYRGKKRTACIKKSCALNKDKIKNRIFTATNYQFL